MVWSNAQASLISLLSTSKVTALMQNDCVSPWMNHPHPYIPHSAPCSHFSDSTPPFSLHWCSSSSPCHHDDHPDQWCGCQYWFSDSLSVGCFILCIATSFTDWLHLHADWLDVSSSIMNTDMLIFWITTGYWYMTILLILHNTIFPFIWSFRVCMHSSL